MMSGLSAVAGSHVTLGLALGFLGILTACVFYLFFSLLAAKQLSRHWLPMNNCHSTAHLGKWFAGKFGGRYLEQLWRWHFQRWLKCGYGKVQAESRTHRWLLLLALVGMVVACFKWQTVWDCLIALGLLEMLFFILTEIQAKARQAEFATGVYRVYRYMALQMTAGMSPAETLRHLHEAVSEPYLKEAVYSFSSCYFRTMDLEVATEELVKRIAGDEIQVLATVLRQGVETGDAYGLIQKQEQLMLKRYYAALETETAMMQAKGIGLATGLCLLVFVLLALPMLYEMSRASRMIFN